MMAVRRRLRLPDGSFALLLLVVLLLSVVGAVQSARWVSRLPYLEWLALGSLFTGLILARSRLPWLVGHFAGLMLGVILVGWLSTTLIDRGLLQDKVLQLVFRINAWGYAARTGGINNDSVPFVATVLFATWLIGYYAAWSVFRTRRVWGAILPGGIALLLNLSYASSAISWYLFLYLFGTLLLIVNVNYELTRQIWRNKGLSYSNNIGILFLRDASVVGLVIVLMAWFTPRAEAVPSAGDIFTQFADPWRSIQGDFNRLFASVAARDKTFSNDFSDTLALRTSTSLSDEAALKITSDEPHYWRAITYDSYTGQGWVSNGKEKEYTPARSDSAYAEQFLRRKTLQQTLVFKATKNDLFFAAGVPVWFDFPTNIEFDPGAKDLDVTAARGAIALRSGQTYTVKSSVSVASIQELQEAGTEYPQWVKDRYLQLPRTLPRRIRSLAEQLTNRTGNSYDKALAIEDYLRKLEYDRNVGEIPYGRDMVDLFLFSTRKGYCDYFATSMAVMLRSVGIPARVASGYMTGSYDPTEGDYVVRESDAHSWTEVYFPEYGWIEFEPTSANPPIYRPLTAITEDLNTEVQSSDSVSIDGMEELTPSALQESAPTVDFVLPWQLLPLLSAVVIVVLLAWYLWGAGSGRLVAEMRVYDRFCRVSRLTRLGPRKHETPLEFAGRVKKALPGETGSIDLIAKAYVDSRYGNRLLSEEEKLGVKKAWVSLSYRMIGSFWRRIPRLPWPNSGKKRKNDATIRHL